MIIIWGLCLLKKARHPMFLLLNTLPTFMQLSNRKQLVLKRYTFSISKLLLKLNFRAMFISKRKDLWLIGQ